MKKASLTPLSGVKVLEFAGLAPGPYCGMILADFGAEVIRIDRTSGSAGPIPDPLCRGKKSIAVNLKSKKSLKLLSELAEHVDIVLDPFRPGVLERLGLGPDVLLKRNPRLIYARLTGWGQTGPFSQLAGHDINYISVAGALSLFARKGERPIAPVNILGDFAGGGMLCAIGILLALYEREKSGQGQVVDAAMVDGVSHLISFIHKLHGSGLWKDEAGTNVLDTGAPFYDTYACADGKYMAVGAIEPQFYATMMEGLGLDNSDDVPGQLDRKRWPILRKRISDAFAAKPRSHWERVFANTDACVTPVLSLTEVPNHPHNKERHLTVLNDETGEQTTTPAPRLSRTPGKVVVQEPCVGEHTIETLAGFGIKEERIRSLLASGDIMDAGKLPSRL